jgi:hypothetical protein
MMFRQREMIAGKMAQLEKMRGYLSYCLNKLGISPTAREP